ncbi:hypothetical protein K435DRAFT_813400, partial [Dendrothele bispora CBS 962.96]
DQCGRETGLELLGPSTYGYFDKSSEILNVSCIHNLLKGKLPFNYREHFIYLSEERWSDGEPAFTAAFRWIHQEGHKLAEFDGWKEEDWLCDEWICSSFSLFVQVLKKFEIRVIARPLDK